ncbi:MAG: hypothetical protein L0Y35_00160, partial [Flammeovirgaceae bacterium]|nr:hypothetical protein [Flammeovirgaceae bacterium]
MRKLLFIVALMFGGKILCIAQIHNYDSLVQASDSAGLYAQLEKTKLFWNDLNQQEFDELAISISKKFLEFKDPEKQFHSMLFLARYLSDRKLYPKAGLLMRTTMELSDQIGKKVYRGELVFELANIYRQIEPSLAIPYYEGAVELFQQSGRLSDLAAAYYEYSILLFRNNDFRGAISKAHNTDSVYALVSPLSEGMKLYWISCLN